MPRFFDTGTRVSDRLDNRSPLRLQSDRGGFQNPQEKFSANFAAHSRVRSSASRSAKGRFSLFGRESFGQPSLQIQTLDRQGSLNNSINTAQRLGDLTGKAQFNWADTVSSNNPSDFFQFSLSRRTKVKLDLKDLTANADLRLLSNNGSELRRSVRDGSQSERINRTLSAGTYYVQIAHNDQAEARYTLSGNSSGRTVDAGNSTNNPLDAGLLNQTKRQYRSQLGGSDQNDTYRFDLTSEGTVSLSLLQSGSGSNTVAMQLLDSTGAVIPQATNSSGRFVSQKLIPGSYFVQVSTNNPGKTSYTLEMSAAVNAFAASGGITTPPPSNPRPTNPRPSNPSNPFSNGNTWGNPWSNGNSGGNNPWGGGTSGNGGNGSNGGNSNGGNAWGNGNTGNRGNSNWGGGSNPFGGNGGNAGGNLGNGRSLIRITRTDRNTNSGLVELEVALVQGNATVDRLSAVAGQPGKQFFRRGNESRSGSMEPLPEGYWSLGAVDWASGRKGDFSRNWADSNDGLGPVWVSMTPTFRTDRSAIGFHLDNNADRGLPGTVGCVGITNRNDLSKFVSWFDNATAAPKVAMVDWGLGTV